MRFFKLFQAAGHLSDAAALDTKLAGEVTSVLAKPSSSLAKFKLTNNVMHFADTLPDAMSKGLKIADDAYISKIFNSTTVPPIFKNRIVKEAREFPDYHLHQNKLMDAKIRAKFSDEEIKLLNSGTAEQIAANEKFKQVFEQVKGKTIISLSGRTLIVGASIYVFVQLISSHQKNMTGCFVTTLNRVTQQLTKCRLTNLSCDGTHILQNNAQACGNSITSVLPADMKGDKCQDSTVDGYHCQNCPSDSFGESKEDIIANYNSNRLDGTEIDEMVVECLTPTFFDAMSDAVGNVGDSVVGAIESIPGIISNVIKYGLIGFGVCILLIVLFAGIKFVRDNFFNSNKYKYAKLDEENDQN